MSHLQQQQGPDRAKIESGFVLLVMRALACSVEVFLHRSSTFGERYLGAQAAIAAAIMLFLPAFAPAHDPTSTWCFLGVYVLACASIRAGIVKRKIRGEIAPHSFYTGTPVLLGRGRGETAVKRFVEPVVVWIASAALAEFDPLLAGYLAAAGLGLLLSVSLTAAAERKRMLDMHDAYVEQRRAAEDWRSMYRE
ncbi:MAG: hypothetical protein ACKVXR_04760 [Planctomycetota bacterium]